VDEKGPHARDSIPRSVAPRSKHSSLVHSGTASCSVTRKHCYHQFVRHISCRSRVCCLAFSRATDCAILYVLVPKLHTIATNDEAVSNIIMSKAQSPYDSLRNIPLSYDSSDSHNSALNLILTLRPEWRETNDTIEFERFTDGITNTVCINLHPSCDTDSVPSTRLRRRTASKGGEQTARPLQDRDRRRCDTAARIRKRNRRSHRPRE
jgi:hypothetical protein